MRRLRATLAVLGLTLLAGCSGTGPTPVPQVSQPPDPFRSTLMPLDVGSSWWYARPASPNDIEFVHTILSEDTIGDRRVRWLQLNFAEAVTARVALFVQDDDVYIAATEQPDDGTWTREVLPEPRLFRPGPGVRTWTPGFPDEGASATDWQQTDSGPKPFEGVTRQTWTAERRFRTRTEEVLHKEVRAERVGTIQIVLSAPNGANPVTYDLQVRIAGAPEFSNIWAGYGPGTEDGQPALWAIDFASGDRRLVTPIGNATITNWTEDQGSVTFAVMLGGATFSWAGTVSGAGLSGVATYGERRFILDFRLHPELEPAPAASPGPSASAAG
jgi:hypothetical protein